jgi:signal transduction histidine kinase
VRALLDDAASQARQALAELRELASGIHPSILTEAGLGPALESLAERAPLPVSVEVSAGGAPAPVEAAAYYVVSEALANIGKHAGARSASVCARRENGLLVLEISDDGVGGADAARGSGLRGMADRLAALDGWMEVRSVPGQGTRIEARIPCASS